VINMASVNKNVNFGLLLILAVTVVAFVGTSTYYQRNFYNVSSNFEEKAAELEAVSEHLQLEKSKLNETSFQLTIKKSREQELSKISEDLTKEKTDLELNKKNLQAQLAKTSQDLLSSQQDFTKAQLELSDVKTDLAQRDERIEDLESRSSKYRNQRDDACALITVDKPSFC